MNPTYDFTGQTAFVTGAASGMGLATARAFAGAGASVTLADLGGDALESAGAELRDAGHRVLAVPCDVTDEDQVAAAVARTVETFGSLDLAYNNAGVQSPTTDAADETAEVFDRLNAICPGTIETPMVTTMLDSGDLDRTQAEANQPIDRLGTAEEIAAAALWLCSPGAAFVVGVALPVAGGYTAV